MDAPGGSGGPGIDGVDKAAGTSDVSAGGSGDLVSGEETDTIAAISTVMGSGAIGIVRVSGPKAVEIAGGVFRSSHGGAVADIDTFALAHGHVVQPGSGEAVDEVLLAVMRKPRSYTREDVVELHCHGGALAVRAVLRVVLELGARIAEPGEFTRRAFLNGRIDLAQAESVAGIVAARSAWALRASVRQLEGGLSDRLKTVRRELVGALAQIEASVDFSDEDIEDVDWRVTQEVLRRCRESLGGLMDTALLGRALESGVRTAIVGKPNVGKSSLLNALVRRERAIVSPLPGTTRDTVEEDLEIGGIPIRLVDTAGLRAESDEVERMGIERSVRALEQADLMLLVVDLGAPGEADELDPLRQEGPALRMVVGNKVDMAGADSRRYRELQRCVQKAAQSGGRGGLGSDDIRACCVSALTGEGIDRLRGDIESAVIGHGCHLEEPVLASERQRVLVEEAARRLDSALDMIAVGQMDELVAEDVRGAAEAIGRITGEELSTDLLDEIFSRFCLGK